MKSGNNCLKGTSKACIYFPHPLVSITLDCFLAAMTVNSSWVDPRSTLVITAQYEFMYHRTTVLS